MSDPDRNFEAAVPLAPGSEAPSAYADAAAAASGERASPPPIRKPGFGVSRMFVTVLAACALVAALVAWLDGRRTQSAFRDEVAQRLAGIETSTMATAKSEVELAGLLRDAQAKINLLESQLDESQSQQAALEALYRDLAPSRDEIAISEIEQVLLVANQQLQLAGNVPSALTAMQLADLKLRQLDRPQFLPLRRALANDMDALRAVPFVDVTGLSLTRGRSCATWCASKGRIAPRRRSWHRRSSISCARTCVCVCSAPASRCRITTTRVFAQTLLPPTRC